MEQFYLGLADNTRLRLLNLMRGREVCVEDMAAVLHESQPKISRHLAYLRKAGLAEARRDGKRMHYRVVEPDDAAQSRILEAVLEQFDSVPQLTIERDRLEVLRPAVKRSVFHKGPEKREPYGPRRRSPRPTKTKRPEPVITATAIEDDTEGHDEVTSHNELADFLL